MQAKMYFEDLGWWSTKETHDSATWTARDVAGPDAKLSFDTAHEALGQGYVFYIAHNLQAV